MHARKGVPIYFFKVGLPYLIMKSIKNTSKGVKNKVVTSTGGKLTVIVHCNFDELVNTDRLKPNPANPNIHPASQLNKLAKIIAVHGWRHPITISRRSGFIVAGHARLLAAQKLELKQVPVDYQPFHDEAEEYAVLVADNVISELAETDGQKMTDILRGLDQFDYDLSLTGLDPAEIEEYILGPTESDPKDDEIPGPPKKPITKKGELWHLGKHRLICGDSSNPEIIKKLMLRSKATIIFTDPPYGVNYDTSKLPNRTRKWAKMKGDDLNAGQLREFSKAWLNACKDCLVNNWAGYVFFGDNKKHYFMLALDELDIHYPVPLVWVKNNFPLTWLRYHPKHEPIVYCGPGSVPTGRNSLWYGPNNEVTVWEHAIEVSGTTVHPTQKPVELIIRAIRNSTRSGNIVLDTFLGSGSTLIACEKTNRKCYGVEIEPVYCDVTIERWQNFTGKKAKKIKLKNK